MTNKQILSKRRLPVKIIGCMVLATIALLPFHAFFTTWLGSNLGHLDLWRIWKELLLIPITVATFVLVCAQPRLRAMFFNNPLVLLCLLYVFMTLGTGVVALRQGAVTMPALLFALLSNVRFIIFFIVAWVAAVCWPRLGQKWKVVVLAPAAVVVLFGLMQLVLPANFLTHFGYGARTIAAVQTVDQQVNYQRIQSTLRGSNPLGAYLVLIITVLVGLWFHYPNHRKWLTVFAAAALVVLAATFSRSAWLGLLASLAVLMWYVLPASVSRKKLLLIGVGVVLVATVVVGGLRQNNVVQNSIFHSSEASPSATSSNAARLNALRGGVQEVRQQPLGRGPGTAGPASFRNTPHPPRIAENYYIQLAQEVGAVGLLIFVAINITVGWVLWRRRGELLPLVLLASLVGITVINMVSHAWADDSLSLIWWGLAGIALGMGSPAIMKAKIHHGKTKTT